MGEGGRRADGRAWFGEACRQCGVWYAVGVAEAYADAKAEKDPVLRKQKVGLYIQKHVQFINITKKAQERNKLNPQMVGVPLGQHALTIHQEIQDKLAKKAEAEKPTKPKKKAK